MEKTKSDNKLDFSYLSSIQYKFNELRMTMYFVMAFSALIMLVVVGFSYYYTNKSVEESRRLIYVMDKNNQTNFIGLKSMDKTENRGAEAKYHMVNFHKIFFTIYPDVNEINKNIKEASKYGDNSIIRLYKDFQEKEYYDQIIQGNVHQMVDIDSVNIDTSIKPYKVKTIFTLTSIRESTVQKQRIITESYLRDIFRTENNPSGFFIERLRLTNIQNISETSRE
jgi:conjugative transposon TraK protein